MDCNMVSPPQIEIEETVATISKDSTPSQVAQWLIFHRLNAYVSTFAQYLGSDIFRELAYHLVLKHYDLASLQIALNCPECLENYDNFVEFNTHYCCPKGVINRSARVCKPCCTEFLSHKRFRVHQQFHLQKYRPKICFLCDKAFRMEEDFYEHIMYGHKSENELNLMCRHCDTVCEKISFTYKIVHDQRDDNDCKICGEQFHFKGKLKIHVETHNEAKLGKVFVCNTCGQCEPDMASFDYHNHNKIKEEVIEYCQEETNMVYACEFCEKAFSTPMFLKQHRLRMKHDTYNCDLCVEVFGRFQTLKTHRLRHEYGEDKISKFPTGRNYVCDFGKCEVGFLHWHLLKKHTSTHVWMNASKKCKLCGVVLENYTKLMYHLEKVHCEIDMEEKAMQSCPACMKMFKTKVGLSIHLTAKHSSSK
uniref:C2H2-type domain-containing protein n=1 Tax=Megaselia scalaris TaxID=36166 RepID=T1GXZ1_MEGSC